MGLVSSVLQTPQQGVEDDDDVTKRRLPNDYAAYRPISSTPGEEQIRLLHLLPAEKDDDEITGLLVDAPPDWKKMSYIALSYCWGGLSEPQKINMIHFDRNSKDMYVEGGDQSSSVHEYVVTSTKHKVPFNVTQNLYGALKALRRVDRKTRAFLKRDNYAFWIDAICINQADMAERSSQVGSMGRIYSDATVVFVWLGESADTMRGLSLVHAMNTYARNTWGSEFDELEPKEEQILALFQVNFNLGDERLGPESLFQILDRLFSNPYFKRMWVLQEATIKAEKTYIFSSRWLIPMGWIILANRFCHTWRRLYPTVDVGQLPVIWTQMLQERLVRARADPEGKEHKRMLMCLPQLFFSVAKDFDSTDPRDKVYALLDLSLETRKGSEARKELAPDYTKSTSQLFCEFTTWCIRVDGGGLDILAQLGAGPRRLLIDEIAKLDHDELPGPYIDATTHPSWAIWPTSGGYWSQNGLARGGQENGPFSLAGDQEPRLFDLRGHPKARVPEALRSRFLAVGGRRIGVVKSMHRMPIRRFDSRENSKLNNRWLTKELEEDMKKYKSTPVLRLTHPYRANESFHGGLVSLWDCLRRKQTGIPEADSDGMIMWGKKTLSPEVAELLQQEWLGREGGRYEGNEHIMFRDFLETLLLSPLHRDEASGGGSAEKDDDEIPDGPWNDDPEIATSLAIFWSEHDPQFQWLPPRIAKFLKGAPLQQAQEGLRREKLFPFLYHALGKCFFITEDERMGLCPPGTRQGDVVVALFGASVPFVIRPVGNEPDFEGNEWDFEGHAEFTGMLYRYIGDCYVHGSMTSEYLKDKMAKGGRDEVFTLC